MAQTNGESIVKVKTAELSGAQMKFMRELRGKGNLKLPATNKTANALARKGLIHFVVYFGWVPTSAGLNISIE